MSNAAIPALPVESIAAPQEASGHPLTIRRCARCGRRHERLMFAPFLLDNIGRWNAWSLCPENGEPLLMHLHTAQFMLRGGCECPKKDAVTA